MNLVDIRNRIYQDFLAPSRVNEYATLLESILGKGYRFITIRDFWRQRETILKSNEKICVLRHDVDSGVNIAKVQWETEKRVRVPATYYFRLATIDVPFMQEIERLGGEVGYHYEEIAGYAKRLHIRSVAGVIENLGNIRAEFVSNIKALRQATQLPITTVASHGDFVNRKLGIANTEILKDGSIRAEAGIEMEAYDEAAMSPVTCRITDTVYPRFWKPESPAVMLEKSPSVLYLLTHTRVWGRNPWPNICDNLLRLKEEISWFVL